MVKEDYLPKRGDLVWLNFSPQKGHEQRGRRPALVLSPKTYHRKTGLMLACPITSQVKGYPFEVLVKVGPISGVVLSDHIKNLDWRARDVELIAPCPEKVILEVLRKIEVLLQV